MLQPGITMPVICQMSGHIGKINGGSRFLPGRTLEELLGCSLQSSRSLIRRRSRPPMRK